MEAPGGLKGPNDQGERRFASTQRFEYSGEAKEVRGISRNVGESEEPGPWKNCADRRTRGHPFNEQANRGLRVLDQQTN